MASVIKLEVEVKDLMRINEELYYFLKEKLTIAVKHRLLNVRKQVESALKLVNELQIELIKKYDGKEIGKGTWRIEEQIEKDGEKVDNPLYADYKKEFDDLMAEKREISHTPVAFKDIKNLVSDKDYDKVYLFVTGFDEE